MRIHPVFHNSLIKPYYETKEHGPNYEKPPPKIVNGEEGHYKIESILKARCYAPSRAQDVWCGHRIHH
jgi:hypothetical protein